MDRHPDRGRYDRQGMVDDRVDGVEGRVDEAVGGVEEVLVARRGRSAGHRERERTRAKCLEDFEDGPDELVERFKHALCHVDPVFCSLFPRKIKMKEERKERKSENAVLNEDVAHTKGQSRSCIT